MFFVVLPLSLCYNVKKDRKCGIDTLKKNKIGFAVLLAAAVNLVLFFVKLYTGLATQSISIYSDAINNLLDTLSCGLAFSGTLWMKKKASPDYPDGFSKAEYLTGFVMSALVLLTGACFAYSSLERLIYPRPVNYLLRYAVILVVAAVAKLTLGLILKKINKKQNSLILETVYIDSLADCGVTLMVLISFILTDYAGIRADAVFGLAVSALVIINSVKLIKKSVSQLMNRNDSELMQKTQDAFEAEGLECRCIKAANGFAAVELKQQAEAETLRKIENELKVTIYIRTEK